MSEVKVNKVSPRTGTDVTLGDSGDTFTVPSGATLTTTSATVNLPATTTVTTELKTNKISPASGTAFTLGDSGDTFTIPAGATIANSGTATGFGGGSYNLLSTTTVSSAVAQVDITSNIDSTYKNYAFILSDVHNATDDVRFQVQFFSSGGSPDTGSHYVYAGSGHRSDNAGLDMNSTGTTQGEISIAPCSLDAGHRHDQFVLYLFNPAGTDSYKMMISNTVQQLGNDKIGIGQIGITYAKTIAVTGVRFKMASGNIDRGIFKLYGISQE